MTLNLDKILNSSISVAKEAGSFLKKEINNIKKQDIEVKGKNDFVTYVDKTAEEFIIKELNKLLPEAGIIAEESQQQIIDKHQYHWIIDPLDGTTNYIHGIPLYSVSIALTKNMQELLGIVYEVNMDECFYAHINTHAFMNNKKIKVSDKSKLEDAFLVTGFPSIDYSKFDAYMEMLKSVMFSTQGVRRLGSAAVDIAYVACGRFDAFFEYNLNPWDVAGGTIIVKQAGGNVYDFSGGNNYLFGNEIVTSNKVLDNELFSLIKKHFKK